MTPAANRGGVERERRTGPQPLRDGWHGNRERVSPLGVNGGTGAAKVDRHTLVARVGCHTLISSIVISGLLIVAVCATSRSPAVQGPYNAKGCVALSATPAAS